MLVRSMRQIKTSFSMCRRLKSTMEGLPSYDAASTVKDANWRIVAASIVERLPVVLPDPEEWEVAYEEMKEKLDSQHMNRFPQEFFTPGSGDHIDADLNDETPINEEDIVVRETFKLAPRTTEDDAKNNRKSLNRKLSERLFLLVKKERESYAWGFPQTERVESEKMRDAAARQLSETCGEALEVYTMGNAPIGHASYLYPTAVDSYDGAKVFYYKAQYLSGAIESNHEYVWVTKSEMAEYLEQEYYNYIKHLLP